MAKLFSSEGIVIAPPLNAIVLAASLTINDPYLCTWVEPCSGPIIMREDPVDKANREFRERQRDLQRANGNLPEKAMHLWDPHVVPTSYTKCGTLAACRTCESRCSGLLPPGTPASVMGYVSMCRYTGSMSDSVVCTD